MDASIGACHISEIVVYEMVKKKFTEINVNFLSHFLYTLFVFPDPAQYTEDKLNLLASHRTEMHELELSLDDDAGKQLEDLHKQLANGTKEKIKRNKEGLFKELMSQGEYH